MLIYEVADKLSDRVEYDAAKEHVPRNKGLYMWFHKSSHEVVYVGIAIGEGGLYRRIVGQHLNPNYLEFRESKHTLKDHFQVSRPVKKTNTKGELVNGIDKSSFRKAIGRARELSPGGGTLAFIKDQLYFRYLVSDDEDYLKSLEKELIGKYSPKYNTALKVNQIEASN